MRTVIDNFDQILKAFGYTVALFVVSAALALLFGTLLVALRVGPVPVLSRVATIYVAVVRNTPLLIIFSFFAFAAPKLGLNFKFVNVSIGPFDFTSFFAGAIASLTLYTAAFVAEALRSGINAVPLGQAEAARAIGLPFSGVLREVVLPQAFRASVPPVASVLIAMLKNTSVAAIFGIIEAAAEMKSLVNDHTTDRWAIFFAIAAIYILLVELLSLVATILERRWRVA